MPPGSTAMFSSKVATKLVSMATSAVSSAGFSEESAGGVVSGAPGLASALISDWLSALS